MKSGSKQRMAMAVFACINLLFLVASAYGANVVISGDYTDVGTIVFVSPKFGDTPQANGTALINTLNGIAAADAANPILIKLGPGVYNLGTNSLVMKQYVSIEGSGEAATKITSQRSSSTYPPAEATVHGASYAEIRFLTVENIDTGIYTAAMLNTSASPSIFKVTATASGGMYSYGVFNDNSSSPAIRNVTVTASGARDNYGIYNNSSSPTMTNVTVTVSGGENACGVMNISSSPTMTSVSATGSDGWYNYGITNVGSGTVKINNSVISGTTYSLRNMAGTTYVGATQLIGTTSNSGTIACVNLYDGSYAKITAIDGTTCQ